MRYTSSMHINLEQEIRNYLPNTIHMSLGTSRDNMPWVCEVHFAWDDDLNLYFRSLAQRRHCQEIVDNPNVAGNIVKQLPLEGGTPKGVYFEGTAEHLMDVGANHPAYNAINNRFKLGQKILDDAANLDGNQFYKITVKHWYVFGNLEEGGLKKYHLPWKA